MIVHLNDSDISFTCPISLWHSTGSNNHNIGSFRGSNQCASTLPEQEMLFPPGLPQLVPHSAPNPLHAENIPNSDACCAEASLPCQTLRQIRIYQGVKFGRLWTKAPTIGA